MASIVYTFMSLANVVSMPCSVRPELSPCTCEPRQSFTQVELSCEKVDSFHQIVDALSNKFSSNISISLSIAHSQLDDLEMKAFKEMNLNMTKLRLQSSNLRSIPELPFRGLSNMEFLSLAENDLDEIPKHVLNHLPKLSTLDLAKGRIRSVGQDDFKGIQRVRFLFLVSNNITRLDKGAFPTTLSSLHLGRNQITSLNGTLRDLNELETLFINMNNISSLDNELPNSPGMKLILAQNNSIERLPANIKDYTKIDTLYFQNNKLKGLDGILKHNRKLVTLRAQNNEISSLAPDEFLEGHIIEEIDLSCNRIKSLNKCLLPLYNLQMANFSFNNLEEFYLDDIRNLRCIRSLDLSHNKIKKLIGRTIEVQFPTSYFELYLHHNELLSLDGALRGLVKLRSLYLTHNKLQRITAEDFVGLDHLDFLDLSHNMILTLAETASTFLPSLKTLKITHNNLTKLERDLHGLPGLCHAYFSNNDITFVSRDLVSQTRCSKHGVPGKLELWLEENPIMCDVRMPELCQLMELEGTRIRGKSQCIETDQEVCGKLPLIIITYLNQGMDAMVVVPQSILKPDLLPPLLAPLGKTQLAIPIFPTPNIETTHHPKPVENISTTTTSSKYDSPGLNYSTPSSLIVQIDNKTEYPILEYAPIVVSNEKYNSVQTVFSERSSPEDSVFDNSGQPVLLPEEPPENP